MRNIPFEEYLGPRLTGEEQSKRLNLVIQRELSPCQREVIIAYYFQEMSIPEIARERGVHKSTVCRTLHRAERRLQILLKY